MLLCAPLAVALAALLSLPVAIDDAADKANYVEGLAERSLHSLVVDAAQEFLDDYAGHARAPTVRYRMADALYEMEEFADALPHWRTLADLDGFRFQSESQLRLGQCELQVGTPAGAAQALRRLVEQGPQYLQLPARALLGESQMRLENWDAAAEVFTDVLKRQPQGGYARDARVGLVWAAFRRDLFEETAARAEELLRGGLEPELRREIAYLAGESLLELGRNNEAADAFAGVDSGLYATPALRGLGFAHAGAGRAAEAAEAFARLLEQDLDSDQAAEASLQLGSQLLQKGDAEGSLAALQAATARRDAPTLYWTARALIALQRAPEALPLLDAALQAGPDEELLAHVHGARGDVLTQLGRGEEAAQAYGKAGSLDALHAASISLLNEGDALGALERVTPLVEREPESASLRLTRAEALFTLGRYAEAEADFQSVLAAGGAGQMARVSSRLAWCRYLVNAHAEAAPLFARVLRDHPDTPEATEAGFMHGRSLQLADRKAEAVVAWHTFTQSMPNAARRDEALLGMAELQPGVEGLPALETLLADHPESPLRARALLETAERRSAAGDCAGAVQPYADLLQASADPELVSTARYGLAWCLEEAGQHDQALQILAPLVDPWIDAAQHETTPQSAFDFDLSQAALELCTWVAHEAQQPQRAEQCVRALAHMGAAGPVVLDAARTAAAAWRTAERPELALALLGELAQSDDSNPDALIEAVWVALESERVDDAWTPMQLALQRAPDDGGVAEAAFFLGEALFATEDFARAAPLYAASANASGSTLSDKALYKQGFSHLRMDEYAAAASAFERVVQDHPESALQGESLFLLGECRFRLDDFAGAVTPLQRLLAEHQGHESSAKARYRLGLALGQLERWDEAEPVLADLARQSPDFPQRIEAELWRARALAALGSQRAAQAAFERVISEDRGLLAARARIGLGGLWIDEGRLEPALSEYLKVAVLYTTSDEVSQALYMAGHCLERMGDPEQARARYQEVIAKHPSSSWATQARDRLQAL
ncbi:MAG: hypothetical protein DHS20C15_15380 [Planctomycetota bacterium]|nr:MAG: hypothetical protein DHS20C15_15380 [Planctomycetota bacterium]